jgi:hypothetical protein
LADVAVDDFYLSSSISTESISEINRGLPGVLDSVLAGTEKGGKPKDVKRILEGTKSDFIQAAVDALLSKSVSRWRITMGLGGAEELPGIRILAVIRESFLLAERITALGLDTPRIRFIKATALANRINGWDLGRMNNVAITTFKFIRDYATAFHPGLADNLELLIDAPVYVDELIETVIAPMEKVVGPLPEIEKLGERRSTSQQSRVYALAHAFQLEAVVPRDHGGSQQWNKPIILTEPDFVIIAGGAAERLFVDPIRIASESAPTERFKRTRRMHIILQAGEKPGYLPDPSEPRIGTGLTSKQAYILEKEPGHVGNDWQRILRDVNRAEELIDFCGGWRT